MKIVHKLGHRIFINLGELNITVMRSHANYELKVGRNYYHLSVPFNPFVSHLYGFYISPDGTPGSATYYRPKREWGLVEPQDPEYLALIYGNDQDTSS